MSKADRNPWLFIMFLSGVVSVLIGLVTVLVQEAKQACGPAGGDCGPEFFSGTQIVGFGLIVFGVMALIVGMATAAICWHFGGHDEP